MSQSDTPETDAQEVFTDHQTMYRGKAVTNLCAADFARKLERERDAAQEKLSTVYQWIERHHQDGFTDSMTYWQNLERIGDKYSDRIDDAERQRDAARENAERLAGLLKRHDEMRRKAENQGQSKEGYREFPICRETRAALAAHEAIAKN